MSEFLDDQTPISKFAQRHLKDLSRSFRQYTTTKEHWEKIRIHQRNNGAMPIILDPDVFSSSHERRNSKWDTSDMMRVIEEYVKNSYRIIANNRYSRTAKIFSTVAIAFSILLSLNIFVPAVRNNVDNISQNMGRLIGVKIDDKDTSLAKVELKIATKGVVENIKSWFENRNKNTEQEKKGDQK